ncbi:MAG: glycine zipper 2TM domain-containing protein [Luteimonas sp.]
MKTRILGATAMLATLAVAGCATTLPGYGGGYSNDGYNNNNNNGYNDPPPAYGNNNCYDCGTVTRIETVGRGQSAPNATGAVLGGIVGAAAGHGISDHTGGSKGNRNVAAIVGAVGGALAGNAIQNNVQSKSTYYVYVRFNDGRTTVVQQNDLAGIREGSYVQVQNNRAYAR